MALLYGFICSWAVVLRKFAAWKHNRLKKIYQTAELAFQKVEHECKSHEVAIGSPSDYQSQMKLLRMFDEKEQARTRWIAAENKLAARVKREKSIRKFTGKKLPYTFGLLDMAIVFKFIDAGRELGNLDLASLYDLIKSWI